MKGEDLAFIEKKPTAMAMKGGDLMNKKKPAAVKQASPSLKPLRMMSMPKLISPPGSPPKPEAVSKHPKLHRKPADAMEKADLDRSNSDNKLEPRATSGGGEESELEPKTSSGGSINSSISSNSSSNSSSSSSSNSSSSSSGFAITKVVAKNSVRLAGLQRVRVASGKNSRGRLSSIDELTLRMLPMVPKKKPSAAELHAQKKLKMAEYGRVVKNGAKLHRSTETLGPHPANIPPSPTTSHDQLKSRCKFITAQTDPAYISYHDDEWGVPVYDDRLLFELLVLVGAQVELSWPTILRKRDAYRSAFSGFDPEQVATYSEKRIAAIESDRSIMLHSGKIRGVVENARRILQVNEEFGSFSKYLWSFVNYKAMASKYRYPKQVPVKTSKSEWMSKDLVRRGFRFVGPTIMYSFMQASGMVNDHLLCCFRHSAIEDINASSNKTNGSVDWDGADDVEAKPEIEKHPH